MNSPAPPASEPSLEVLELLRDYKKHFARDAVVNVSPFANDGVVRYAASVEAYDVPRIHQRARAEIEKILREIHAGKPSRIVILAGNPGMGKSHLINQFRPAERATALGYLLISNSNHWKSNEFDACLLDWILDALVRPSPDGPHLLLKRIEDVAFAALAAILAQPGHLRHFARRGATNYLSRAWSWLRGGSFAAARKKLDQRDASVFRDLDFASFAKYVCNRFLAATTNPFHRYVVHVLLRYLFAEDREYVLHWLRRRPIHEFFLKKLGIHEEIDTQFKTLDTVKILISLFTPEVAARLANGPPEPGASRVFFFAFDQVEGRDELFDDAKDWRKFFAQLSELYNDLPNVFIAFTMTLSLRDKLYPDMEGQFRDRIPRDQSFTLSEIENDEVLDLYRRRVERWTEAAPNELWARVVELGNPYLPFDQGQVLEMAATRTLRDMLARFDHSFDEYLNKIVVVDPSFDYLVARKGFQIEETAVGPYPYTEDFLDLLKDFFADDSILGILQEIYRLRIKQVENDKTDIGTKVLRVEFGDSSSDTRWVRVNFARLGFTYQSALPGCLKILAHRQKHKNQLWLFRVNPIELDTFPVNAFFRLHSPSAHTDWRAMFHTLQNRSKYKPGVWDDFAATLATRIEKSSLGEMLAEVRKSLDKQAASSPGEITETETDDDVLPDADGESIPEGA